MSIATKKLFLFSLFLKQSLIYNNAKIFFYNILENNEYTYKKYLDFVFIIFIFTSTAIYLYDIRHINSPIMQILEDLTVVVFAAEYCLRFWVASSGHDGVLNYFYEKEECGKEPKFFEAAMVPIKDKFIFIIKPQSVIDFVSIFPSMQILRIFKLFKYSDGARNFFAVFNDKKHEVTTLAILISITLFISSALFYLFEQENKNVNTFFDAVYWASITISTVGYGDISPITDHGRLIAIVLVFSGLGVIAMLTSLITTGLSQKISELKERKYIDASKKLKSYILIAGFGDMGRDLASKLSSHKTQFIIFDKNDDCVADATNLGYYALKYDATKPVCLKNMDIANKAVVIVCLTNSDMTNISIAIAARSIGFRGKIISRAIEIRNEDKMRLAGINNIINQVSGANFAVHCFSNPRLHEVMSSVLFSQDGVGIEEISLNGLQSNFYANELEFKKLGCTLLGVFDKSNYHSFIFKPKLEELMLTSDSVLIVYGKVKRIGNLRESVIARVNIE